LTNGVFLEEEFDLTRGTEYTGLGSEHLINGGGSWFFHENSLIASFEGEVENGKMKNGTLFSKDITIKSIPPFLKSLKGVITEGDLAQAIEEGDGSEDKIWQASFVYTGEWKNNAQQRKGHLQIFVCVCPAQIGNNDFQFIDFINDCEQENIDGFNVIKLFSLSLAKKPSKVEPLSLVGLSNLI
jgi:hypothetical protein